LIGYSKLSQRVALTALICCIFSIPVFADERAKDNAYETEAPPAGQADDGLATEERGDADIRTKTKEDTHTLVEAFAGYRFLQVDGSGGRAAE